MNDEKYIRYCFELAKKALGQTSPNPLVGAVLVHKNKIIGEGYHKAYGKPHAEVEAIEDAIKKGNTSLIAGSTLYVNLEPCCHWGKTPPCTEKIIKYKIKKVVCSIIDPNPEVNGKGIKQLISQGIECKVGVLNEEAKYLNRFYLKWITESLPYVTIKSAITFDGKIATVANKSKWITTENSREYVYKLRATYDGIMVGINTVLIDNPSLSSHNFGKNPTRIVVGNISKLLNLNKKFHIFDNKIKTIIFTPNFENKKIKNFYNKENIIFYFYRTKKIPFKQILKTLAKNHNITSVLVEGGGETIWRLLKEKLVDDFIIFMAPKIFGGRTAKTWVEGEGVVLPSKAFKVEFLSIEEIAKDFVIKAKFIK
ncbi:MAG: bifunctional diaminohydroxyphosphoribosylaminopyrimidine deaminase/5-amino-6-(5-phosphoribosylamino)uracil reductase RibD [Endomicrobiia bacterium]